jgi:hypothetical protein
MQKTNCTTCGTDNPVTNKYCSNCGFALPKVAPAVVQEVAQPTPKKKGLPVMGYVGIAIGVATMIAIKQFLFQVPSFDKTMMDVASELNKTCPIMVDQDTRLDNSVALPDNIFQYNYTLVNIEKGTVNVEDLKNYLEPTITNLVKTSPQMQPQRDHEMTLNYFYKDKNGEHLFTVSITPDKYK